MDVFSELLYELMNGDVQVGIEIAELREGLNENWNMHVSCLAMRKEQNKLNVNEVGLSHQLLSLEVPALQSYRKTELNDILEKAGRRQSASFRKNELIDMIAVLQGEVRDGTINLDGVQLTDLERSQERRKKLFQQLRKACIEAWVMKPLVSTVGMREGNRNEPEVLQALPKFLDNPELVFQKASIPLKDDILDLISISSGRSPNVRNEVDELEVRRNLVMCNASRRIDCIKTVGLVCSQNNRLMGDSPDGICEFTDELGNCNVAAVEVKTMTSTKTIEEAKFIRARTSKALILDNIGENEHNDFLFRQTVPNTTYGL
ncbi:unnamed protein product [Agarophyton chilense]